MLAREILASVVLLAVVATTVQAHDMHQAMAMPGGFSSPMIAKGGTWSMTFDQAGQRSYHCHPHPFMEGSIVVEATAPDVDSVKVHITDYSFDPPVIHIRPGTNVTWINDDPIEHMVTESMPTASSSPAAKGDSPSTIGVVALATVATVVALRRGRA